MIDIRPCSMSVVQDMCGLYHGYKSAGKVAVYAFAVYEQDIPVAAFAWQPPPPGASKALCPSFPAGVLALSRMVAVPRNERALKHISKPLRIQMRSLIDRTRWPVLVTYSDESLGHTGHVYKCSGWTPTERVVRKAYHTEVGERTSCYSAGKRKPHVGKASFDVVLQRWEHRVAVPGQEWQAAQEVGWVKVPTGKTWASGNVAYTYIKETT